MKIKYLAFLFLFIFNFTETSLADALHFDSSISIENIDCDHEEQSTSSSSTSKDKECQDHHCAHFGHIHVYLNFPELLPKIAGPQNSQTNFPAYLLNLSSISFDIIKPPIV